MQKKSTIKELWHLNLSDNTGCIDNSKPLHPTHMKPKLFSDVPSRHEIAFSWDDVNLHHTVGYQKVLPAPCL